jgi:hypothetical protein
LRCARVAAAKDRFAMLRDLNGNSILTLSAIRTTRPRFPSSGGHPDPSQHDIAAVRDDHPEARPAVGVGIRCSDRKVLEL